MDSVVLRIILALTGKVLALLEGVSVLSVESASSKSRKDGNNRYSPQQSCALNTNNPKASSSLKSKNDAVASQCSTTCSPRKKTPINANSVKSKINKTTSLLKL